MQLNEREFKLTGIVGRPMYKSASNGDSNLEELRQRLLKMTDADLLRFGRAARHMCSPEANYGYPPRETFVMQLREAKAEWRRRNPDAPLSQSL